MNTEFNWWLLIVGLVVGAALVWLVLADTARRDADLEDEEIPMEAAWIAAALREEGDEIDARTADRVLRLHRAYLAGPPPDGAAQPPASPVSREPAAPVAAAEPPAEPPSASARPRPRTAPPSD